MKKLTLSLSVILSFVLFSLFGKKTAGQAAIIDPQPGANNPPPSTTTNTNPTSGPTGVSVRNSSGLKDGTYIGSVADAFYGNIQVQTIISGGKISDVQFLQYPNDRRHSIEINSQAMPILKSEAIQAQSSQVDTVSGATATSLAFIESLGSALSQARN